MKNKTLIISIALLGYFTTQASEAPILNFTLPAGLNKVQSNPNDLKKLSNIITLPLSKTSSISNLLLLSSTKNSELKAVIKRKTYGLRYTKVW